MTNKPLGPHKFLPVHSSAINTASYALKRSASSTWRRCFLRGSMDDVLQGERSALLSSAAQQESCTAQGKDERPKERVYDGMGTLEEGNLRHPGVAGTSEAT